MHVKDISVCLSKKVFGCLWLELAETFLDRLFLELTLPVHFKCLWNTCRMLISGKFCNWSYLTSEENKKKNGKDEGLFWNALWLAWPILRLACLWPASRIMVMIFSHPCLWAAASKHSHSSICSKLKWYFITDSAPRVLLPTSCQ